MLNSFWNLCRICPSMPIEKLNSEYKTHFKWHESYHTPIQEAVKKTADFPLTFEPAIQRRKKHPDLAYKTHEVLKMVNGDALDPLETLILANRELGDSRARSEERNRGKSRPSPRSRSVDPYEGRRRTTLMTQSYPPASHPPIAEVVPKTTEYRSQFAWPRSVESTPKHASRRAKSATPRKSISMGAIQAAQDTSMSIAKKHSSGESITKEQTHLAGGDGLEDEAGIKSPTSDEMIRALEEQILINKDLIGAGGEAGISQMEDGAVPPTTKPKKFKTEYKSKFKSPAKYIYVDGGWKKNKEVQDLTGQSDEVPVSWYGEVMELRKKAGEYKVRSWGSDLAPDHLTQIYQHQKDVWDQVSRRSSLSALALAATPREKERKKEKAQKERENIHQAERKSLVQAKPRPKLLSATKGESAKTTEATPAHLRKHPTYPRNIPRVAKMEPDFGRGRIPTRHHLERTTPAGDGALLTSPTRDHKLEPAQLQKDRDRDIRTSPAKSKPTSKSSPGLGRSASVGPEGRSPKHTSRPVSASSAAVRTHVNGVAGEEAPKRAETKRPRPTSLTTSASRPRSALVTKGKDGTEVDGIPKTHTTAKTKSTTLKPQTATTTAKESKEKKADKQKDKQVVMVNGDDTSLSKQDKDIFSPAESQPSLKSEIFDPVPVIKSPPEPTRVKSPEQIIVKSPEPVKWTVPLETGIKWTGSTQIDSDSPMKSFREEIKPSPTIAQSSLPEDTVKFKKSPTQVEHLQSTSKESSPTTEPPSLPSAKPMISPSAGLSLASDVLDRARNRFDQFWGPSKD